MPTLPPVHRPPNQVPEHMRDKRAVRKPFASVNDKERGSAHARGYDRKWQKKSKIFRQQNPLCVECLKDGRTRASEVVDHITPHKGDPVLFNDPANWQALCKPCHDRKTMRDAGRANRRPPGG